MGSSSSCFWKKAWKSNFAGSDATDDDANGGGGTGVGGGPVAGASFWGGGEPNVPGAKETDRFLESLLKSLGLGIAETTVSAPFEVGSAISDALPSYVPFRGSRDIEAVSGAPDARDSRGFFTTGRIGVTVSSLPLPMGSSR